MPRRWALVTTVGAVLAAGGCAARRVVPPAVPVWEPPARAEVIAALERAAHAAQRLPEFTCRFHRHERVGGKLGTKQEMEVKFRCRPFSLYMHWVDSVKRGAEMLYATGRYDDVAFAHFGGPFAWLFPTMTLRLDDPLITRTSRHAILDFGLETLAGALLADARRAQAAGTFEARRLGPGDVHGEPADGFEMLLPDQPGYYARRLRLWFHPATGLLSRSEALDPRDQLLEDYAFTCVSPASLTEADFDPRNPAYHFYRP